MAAAVKSQPTAALRRAEIRKQFARVCPRPMSKKALERAASTVARLQDEGVDELAREALRMNDETNICRGAK